MTTNKGRSLAPLSHAPVSAAPRSRASEVGRISVLLRMPRRSHGILMYASQLQALGAPPRCCPRVTPHHAESTRLGSMHQPRGDRDASGFVRLAHARLTHCACLDVFRRSPGCLSLRPDAASATQRQRRSGSATAGFRAERLSARHPVSGRGPSSPGCRRGGLFITTAQLTGVPHKNPANVPANVPV